MKKVVKILLLSFAISGLCTSCKNDGPETPTKGYRFSVDGYAGDDNTPRAYWSDNGQNILSFAWDYTNDENPVYEMKMAMRKPGEGSLLKSLDGSDCTDVLIKPHSNEDTHWAVLETVKEFEHPLSSANYDGYLLYGLHGKGITIEHGSFTQVQIPMPNEFTQTADTDDDNDNDFHPTAHLRDYMYMYAKANITNSSATLDFRHLIVPIRFRVYNWRTNEEPSIIYSVTMKEANGGAISRSRIDYTVSYDQDDLMPEYPQGMTYSSITVKGMKDDVEGFSINPRDQDGDEVMFYVNLLPFGDEEDALKGKTLLFSLEVDDISGEHRKDYMTYELPSEEIYDVTGSYNWIAGNLYTIHLYLDDVQQAAKVTFNDWTD